MASLPLFDISGIDLNQTICDSAGLDEFLPQTGPMRQVNRIVWTDEIFKRCVAIKDVRPDEFWCDHHIKGRPLYPGVLMIESNAQAASWLFRKRFPALGFLGFLRCDETSFRGQVVPGDTFVILVEEIEASPRRFISKSQGFVRGKLVFEAKITGMAI
ncbi:MAG: beta-hydroxyacyl-ACP dehydratase [Planctomycetota bacterium]|nr:beta-hydroxyacyl-ACP dehydratase [Planctomycetota bacterium]